MPGAFGCSKPAEANRERLWQLDRPLFDLPDVLDESRFTPVPEQGDFVANQSISTDDLITGGFGSDEFAGGMGAGQHLVEAWSDPTGSPLGENFVADLDARLQQERLRIDDLERKWDSGERLEEVSRLIGQPAEDSVRDREPAALLRGSR